MTADWLSEIEVLPKAKPEQELVRHFLDKPALSDGQRQEAKQLAREIVGEIRKKDKGGPVEKFMSAYNLSSAEGRALMGLAEALLRVPDKSTRDVLIEDKVTGHHWFSGDADRMVQAAGLALDAAGKIISDEHSSALHSLAHRAGMPVVRKSLAAGMRMMGKQFVMAETIEDAIGEAADRQEVSYSFDMLGEGSRTDNDAQRHMSAYERAIRTVSKVGVSDSGDPRTNNGVSVKLSAIFCRYRTRCWNDVKEVLLPRLSHLAKLAKEHNLPLTIDAEEASRLELSLTLIRELCNDSDLDGWDGLGIVIQAYGVRAGEFLDAVLGIAEKSGRRISVRLVKGAYWDSEIKTAQVKGLSGFPVYTRKLHTDLSYLHLARRLLDCGELVYPQFASHNAVTLAALEVMFKEAGGNSFEVQKLHGMGDAIHDAYHARYSRHLRVYAPVGNQDDLLAYLVRRLLENAANASFLHRLHDNSVGIDELVRDPYELASEMKDVEIRTGADLFMPERKNSIGCDLDKASDIGRLASIEEKIECLPGPPEDSSLDQASKAFDLAKSEQGKWEALGMEKRASILDVAADLFEKNFDRLFFLITKEAKRTCDDAVAEIREAVDFCRYYASQARRLPGNARPRGTVVAISPWNFPLAIFTGQAAAALAVGNAVIAKPAEQTPQIAKFAVDLLHEAGVPKGALQLLFGTGKRLGSHLVSCGEADMVVFTGSTETARSIYKNIAASKKPTAPLLAETGGINAMVVDSTALPERVVDDVISSAFLSAGQRCSSLRVLYVQEDVYDKTMEMLAGAAEQLKIGDPSDPSVDVGPVIDVMAKQKIDAYVQEAIGQNKMLWQADPKDVGNNFCSPVILEVEGIKDVKEEVFGPVLHVARYKAGEEKEVVDAINASGYGLTLGVHSRVLSKQRMIAERARVGNIYINRNQVGAVVGSQPFGGMGMSGTGPKAGGPMYLRAFTKNSGLEERGLAENVEAMPGPDGELNLYMTKARTEVIEAGDGAGESLEGMLGKANAVDARKLGMDEISAIKSKLALRDGKLVPVITDAGGECWLAEEKTSCADSDAGEGGNIALLSLGA